VLLVLLAVADRAGAALAARAVADELQRSSTLTSRPEVTVAGVPFLTQALRGRYERLDVTAADVPAGTVGGEPLTLRTADVVLHGARVPLSDALSRRVTEVPVDRVDAVVLLPWDELARRAGDREVTLEPAGDRVRVRGEVRVLGQRLTASAVSRLTVQDGAITVQAEELDVGNGAADRVLTRALRGRLDFRVPVQELPFGLSVDRLQVRPDGLAVRARADDTVLSDPGR
jgi:hypothetical protein